MTERQQLEQVIAHLESQRARLGDAAVAIALSALRQKLAALARGEAAPLASPIPEQSR